jgi:hypothetical protein
VLPIIISINYYSSIFFQKNYFANPNSIIASMKASPFVIFTKLIENFSLFGKVVLLLAWNNGLIFRKKFKVV